MVEVDELGSIVDDSEIRDHEVALLSGVGDDADFVDVVEEVRGELLDLHRSHLPHLHAAKVLDHVSWTRVAWVRRVPEQPQSRVGATASTVASG